MLVGQLHTHRSIFPKLRPHAPRRAVACRERPRSPQALLPAVVVAPLCGAVHYMLSQPAHLAALSLMASTGGVGLARARAHGPTAQAGAAALGAGLPFAALAAVRALLVALPVGVRQAATAGAPEALFAAVVGSAWGVVLAAMRAADFSRPEGHVLAAGVLGAGFATVLYGAAQACPPAARLAPQVPLAALGCLMGLIAAYPGLEKCRRQIRGAATK